MSERKSNRISSKQVIAVHSLLNEHIIKNDDGNPSYEEGWSDAKIAEAAGVVQNAVMRVRRENFGELRQGVTGKTAELNRIATLERKVRQLECFVEKHFQLEYEACKE